MHIDLLVKYPSFLFDFSENFLAKFRKILKYRISWKSFQWEPNCSMRADGHDADSRFSPFCEQA